MFTLYRPKFPSGGFRAVVGSHLPLDAKAYSRFEFPSSREAFANCTTDAERAVVLLIDPRAGEKPGTWVRVDKGDGERSTVTREEVCEALQVELPQTDATALRKAVMKAEAARTLLGREKSTKYATFHFVLPGEG